MNSYLYDGTYSSLIALIYKLITLKQEPNNIVSEENFIPDLFSNYIYLNMDDKKTIINQLKSKLTKNIFHVMYYAYLSSNNNKEMLIYKFMKNALMYKNDVLYRKNLEGVCEILKISHYVGHEAHRIKGFLRFQKMNNFYYGTIEPTNNVLPIITKHFKERLKDERWIIKDELRKMYAVYDLDNVKILKEDEIIALNLDLNDQESLFADLWKTFFKTISIKERKNLKCQRNNMPKKYWKNMLEMEDEK